jgi:hypothetical protein
MSRATWYRRMKERKDAKLRRVRLSVIITNPRYRRQKEKRE